MATLKIKRLVRFLKAKLTSTNDGKLEMEVLKGQESFQNKIICCV